MANFSFNVESVPEQNTGSYDALPAGMYDAIINGVDLKDSKSGGKYLNIRYDIVGPSHSGRVVFGMITVANSNPKAEEVGRQQLASLLRAIGLDQIHDTDQLIGATLAIKVVVEQSEQYGEQNRVSGYRASSSSVQQTAKAPTTNSPPWARK